MEKGDKVILKEFKSNDNLEWNSSYNKFGGKEVIVSEVDNEDGTFFVSEINYWWLQSACEPVKDSQEYFYLGQTVYSPLFRNSERKAVIANLNLSRNLPIFCEGENVEMLFTLDGRSSNDEDFVSLFQEPIQFTINKPIERFKEGEIVEVSHADNVWFLSYYIGVSNDSSKPYRATCVKINGKLNDGTNYPKIRKIK